MTEGPRCYTKEDLSSFNLLEHPIWVFDHEKKAIWWANLSALTLWNADSLESLIDHRFVEGSSQPTFDRLDGRLCRLRAGEKISEQVRTK